MSYLHSTRTEEVRVLIFKMKKKKEKEKLIQSSQPGVSIRSPQFPKSTASTYNVLNNENGSSIKMIALKHSLIIKSSNLTDTFWCGRASFLSHGVEE